MAYLQLSFPPGILRNGTEYESKGRWFGCNQIRFVEGVILRRGDGVKHSTGAVTGKGRKIIAWRDNSLTRWVAVGTESHLYAMDDTGVLHDITPSGFTTGIQSATADAGGNVTADATVASLDLFGQYLLFCTADDGKIYEWQLNTAVIAAAVSSAPTARALVVTDEEFVFALGAAGVSRRIQWADQASLTTWTPDSTNQAGSFDLQSTGKLMQGKRVKGGTLLLTDAEAYLARWVGGVEIYGFPKLAEGCGAISQNCVGEFDGNAVWMSYGHFWLYNGFVQPLPCEVGNYVFANMLFAQISKVTARVDELVGEVTWHYPSYNGNGENDSYVTWSYREWAFGRNVWSFGGVGRLSGTGRGTYTCPQVVGSDGFIYNEEAATNNNDGTPYIETGPFELGNGDDVMHILQLIPDEASSTLGESVDALTDFTVSLKTRLFPGGAETTNGPYTLARPTDVRCCGRQAKARFDV